VIRQKKRTATFVFQNRLKAKKFVLFALRTHKGGQTDAQEGRFENKKKKGAGSNRYWKDGRRKDVFGGVTEILNFRIGFRQSLKKN